MHNSTALIDLHERAHRNLAAALEFCRDFSEEEVNRELEGFGFPTLRLQFDHVVGAEVYWVGVLKGQMLVDHDPPESMTIESLHDYCGKTAMVTRKYLNSATPEELNTARVMMTWGKKELNLVPAHVILRVVTHMYHHLGQIAAMSRILGKPSPGWDFPIR